MEVLIEYDSNFGNTKKGADYIATQMGSGVSAISVNNFKQSNLLGIKLLIMRSPINACMPTKKNKSVFSAPKSVKNASA